MEEKVKPIRVLCCSAIVGNNSSCCDSCHEDEEEGYSDMQEVGPEDLYDSDDPRSGMWQTVCCGTARFLEAMTKEQRRALWDDAWRKEGQFWYNIEKKNEACTAEPDCSCPSCMEAYETRQCKLGEAGWIEEWDPETEEGDSYICDACDGTGFVQADQNLNSPRLENR